jgi:hypothetical protein
MHNRLADAARFGAAAIDDTDAPPSDLDASRGILLACIVAVPCWALVGMLIALWIRWA